MKYPINFLFILSIIFLSLVTSTFAWKPVIGAYYFDGWAGENEETSKTSDSLLKLPIHVHLKMYKEFSGRKPIWGWRDDNQDIMDKQIRLAAKNGLSYFAFDWYWKTTNNIFDSTKTVNAPSNNGIKLFQRSAQNEMKFCLLVANHTGSEIIGKENWIKALHLWTNYFKDPRYLKNESGSPYIFIFKPDGLNDTIIKALRIEAKSLGLSGLVLVGCKEVSKLPTNFDFSSQYNAVPTIKNPPDTALSYTLILALTENMRKMESLHPFIPFVSAGFDNRPWIQNSIKQRKPFFTRDADLFKESLISACNWMKNNPSQTNPDHLMIIYAWNEIGEGAYLLPTTDDPNARLLKAVEAIQREW